MDLAAILVLFINCENEESFGIGSGDDAIKKFPLIAPRAVRPLYKLFNFLLSIYQLIETTTAFYIHLLVYTTSSITILSSGSSLRRKWTRHL